MYECHTVISWYPGGLGPALPLELQNPKMLKTLKKMTAQEDDMVITPTFSPTLPVISRQLVIAGTMSTLWE